ncbi:hypothetical protein, partial [Salmonella sp. s55962]
RILSTTQGKYSKMNTKLVCFFLVVSVAIAMVTAYDDDLAYDFLENMMEKRGRHKGKSGKTQSILPCPDNDRCFCRLNSKTGEYSGPLACKQSASNVGL